MQSLFIAGQVFVSIMLVALILLQPGTDGGKGMFGGGGGETYHTRKGVEKFLYYLTMFFVAIFILSSIGLLIGS